jgi:hypothetical protein
MKVITNHQPRLIIDANQLTPAERKDFDYLDWAAIDQGEGDAEFFRYRGDLHDLGEFTASVSHDGAPGLPSALTGWDGYRADSFFSALVVKVTDDHDHVIVGLVLS